MSENQAGEISFSPSFLGQSKIMWIAALVVVLVLGIGVRFINLTNPPLDYAAWRQLRSASIARDYYYQMLPSIDPALRQQADATAQYNKLEPQVLERIVALTYFLVGGEYVWIARIFSILFWLIGGLALFDLARRMTTVDGGLVALVFYLLLQFSITVSRSFQPDPFMVMWMLLALNALDRWVEKPSWKWAVLTGVLGGLAIFIKVFTFFMLGMAAVMLILSTFGFRKTLRNIQVWATVGIMGLIPVLYYFSGGVGMAGGYLREWTFPYLRLLTQVRFYFQWLGTLNALFSLVVVLVAALGLVLIPARRRLMVLGLWLGYLIYGATVPSLIISHTYYNLPLVPILSLSLAPIGAQVFSRLAQQPHFWQAVGISIVICATIYGTWLDRNSLAAENYKLEALGWKNLGASLPKGSYIGITHDYNARIGYYGMISVDYWPQVEDMAMLNMAGGNNPVDDPAWQAIFEQRTKGYDYFIVTLFNELDAQPVLKKILTENYVSSQGDGYILFDLHHKKQSQ